jgi:hypothetical protein
VDATSLSQATKIKGSVVDLGSCKLLVTNCLDDGVLLARVDATFNRDLPRFAGLVGSAPPTKFAGSIAICSGGPSVRDHVEKIRTFKRVMICASAHDWAVENGISFQYAVIMDPSDDTVDYVKHPQANVMYLVASICHPGLFDHLKGHNVRVWHPAGVLEMEHYRGEPGVPGGSSAATRAIVLACCLGFRRQHLFGFDSSYETADDDHAYPQPAHRNGAVDIWVTFGGKKFLTNFQLAAQANEFMDQVRFYDRKLWRPVVYGEGLLPEMFRAEQIKRGH